MYAVIQINLRGGKGFVVHTKNDECHAQQCPGVRYVRSTTPCSLTTALMSNEPVVRAWVSLAGRRPIGFRVVKREKRERGLLPAACVGQIAARLACGSREVSL